jgi:hypothetical protein
MMGNVKGLLITGYVGVNPSSHLGMLHRRSRLQMADVDGRRLVMQRLNHNNTTTIPQHSLSPLRVHPDIVITREGQRA